MLPPWGTGTFQNPFLFLWQKKKRFLNAKEKEASMALLRRSRKRHGGLRLFVVTKSAPLYFRLTAKIRCAPLLLLSQMDPLRWAPFGSPSPCAWSFKGDGCWEGGSRGPVRSPAKRVRMGKEPQRSGREFPRGGREGCAACGDAIPPS